MYNAALVMSEQMKAWPTSTAMRQKPDSGWNFFFTDWAPSRRSVRSPPCWCWCRPMVYVPKPDPVDQELVTDFRNMNLLPTPEGRQAAFAMMQQRSLEQVYVFRSAH